VERLSLDERRQRLIENACASCGGSDDGGGSAGDMPNAGDSTGIANDDSSLLKALASVRKKRKPKKMEEAARPRPTAKMLMKAAQLESKAGEEKDREKKFPLYDRIRKIKMKAVDD
jgi:hypothetical protein